METTTIPPSHGVSSGLQNKVHKKHRKNSEYNLTSRCKRVGMTIFLGECINCPQWTTTWHQQKEKNPQQKHKWKSNIDKAPWKLPLLQTRFAWPLFCLGLVVDAVVRRPKNPQVPVVMEASHAQLSCATTGQGWYPATKAKLLTCVWVVGCRLCCVVEPGSGASCQILCSWCLRMIDFHHHRAMWLLKLGAHGLNHKFCHRTEARQMDMGPNHHSQWLTGWKAYGQPNKERRLKPSV
jgi:hypothetical protein